METLKYKKANLLFNIPIMVIILIAVLTPLSIVNKVAEPYYVGIATRIILGIWCTVNGIWNACTSYYSILKPSKSNEDPNTHKWIWWIFVALGIGCLITAFMGYGFNGITKPQ